MALGSNGHLRSRFAPTLKLALHIIFDKLMLTNIVCQPKISINSGDHHG